METKSLRERLLLGCKALLKAATGETQAGKIIPTPKAKGGGVDYKQVPVGSAVWITVTKEGPLEGRHLLITKRPDGLFGITGGLPKGRHFLHTALDMTKKRSQEDIDRHAKRKEKRLATRAKFKAEHGKELSSIAGAKGDATKKIWEHIGVDSEEQSGRKLRHFEEATRQLLLERGFGKREAGTIAKDLAKRERARIKAARKAALHEATQHAARVHQAGESGAGDDKLIEINHDDENLQRALADANQIATPTPQAIDEAIGKPEKKEREPREEKEGQEDEKPERVPMSEEEKQAFLERMHGVLDKNRVEQQVEPAVEAVQKEWAKRSPKLPEPQEAAVVGQPVLNASQQRKEDARRNKVAQEAGTLLAHVAHLRNVKKQYDAMGRGEKVPGYSGSQTPTSLDYAAEGSATRKELIGQSLDHIENELATKNRLGVYKRVSELAMRKDGSYDPSNPMGQLRAQMDSGAVKMLNRVSLQFLGTDVLRGEVVRNLGIQAASQFLVNHLNENGVPAGDVRSWLAKNEAEEKNLMVSALGQDQKLQEEVNKIRAQSEEKYEHAPAKKRTINGKRVLVPAAVGGRLDDSMREIYEADALAAMHENIGQALGSAEALGTFAMALEMGPKDKVDVHLGGERADAETRLKALGLQGRTKAGNRKKTHVPISTNRDGSQQATISGGKLKNYIGKKKVASDKEEELRAIGRGEKNTGVHSVLRRAQEEGRNVATPGQLSESERRKASEIKIEGLAVGRGTANPNAKLLSGQESDIRHIMRQLEIKEEEDRLVEEGKLMPSQRTIKGVGLFINREVGGGKSLCALAAAQMLLNKEREKNPESRRPVVITCPEKLLANWEEQARRWLPGAKVAVMGAEDPAGDAELLRGVGELEEAGVSVSHGGSSSGRVRPIKGFRVNNRFYPVKVSTNKDGTKSYEIPAEIPENQRALADSVLQETQNAVENSKYLKKVSQREKVYSSVRQGGGPQIIILGQRAAAFGKPGADNIKESDRINSLKPLMVAQDEPQEMLSVGGESLGKTGQAATRLGKPKRGVRPGKRGYFDCVHVAMTATPARDDVNQLYGMANWVTHGNIGTQKDFMSKNGSLGKGTTMFEDSIGDAVLGRLGSQMVSERGVKDYVPRVGTAKLNMSERQKKQQAAISAKYGPAMAALHRAIQEGRRGGKFFCSSKSNPNSITKKGKIVRGSEDMKRELDRLRAAHDKAQMDNLYAPAGDNHWKSVPAISHLGAALKQWDKKGFGGSKSIIWVPNTSSVDAVKKMLDEQYGPGSYTTMLAKSEMIPNSEKFKQPNGPRFVIAGKDASSGYNLQVAGGQVFVGMPKHAIDEIQSRGRPERTGRVGDPDALYINYGDSPTENQMNRHRANEHRLVRATNLAERGKVEQPLPKNMSGFTSKLHAPSEHTGVLADADAYTGEYEPGKDTRKRKGGR